LIDIQQSATTRGAITQGPHRSPGATAIWQSPVSTGVQHLPGGRPGFVANFTEQGSAIGAADFSIHKSAEMNTSRVKQRRDAPLLIYP